MEVPTAAQRALLRELQRCLPPGGLITRSEDTLAYECDGLTVFRQKPWAVVLPQTETQVAQVLRACAQAGVAVVPRGAGTGLSGGALPLAGSVLMSLTRMKAIVELDPLARTATLEPGVRNQAISDAAAVHGLFYAPDPSSQLACSIGGNVAENAGGLHCLKYGVTLNNLVRVRGLTLDGAVLDVGCDDDGMNLLPLLVGSEGMLAVVTQVTVRLLPKPACAQVILASFDDVRRAADAVASVIAAGLVPAALEMMDQGAARAIDDCIQAGYDRNARALLLCESDGTLAQVAEEIARMSEVLRGCGATDLRVSQSEEERKTLWAGRKAALTAAARIAPDAYVMDGVLPRKRIGEMLEHIEALQDRHGLRCVNVFHAGDGNLHPIVCFDGADPDQWHRAEAFGADILSQCIALGGSVSGEHGVGVEKLDAMCEQFGAAELGVFHGIKAAFDPAQLLNPGKNIPSLHRCAERGRVHVGAAGFAHPTLPRF